MKIKTGIIECHQEILQVKNSHFVEGESTLNGYIRYLFFNLLSQFMKAYFLIFIIAFCI